VYSTLIFSPAAQKEKIDWNSSMRSSRLRVARLSFLWSYEVFHCSILLRVVIVFRDIIYVIIILYLWHAYVEYLVWHKNRVWHVRTQFSQINPLHAHGRSQTILFSVGSHYTIDTKKHIYGIGCPSIIDTINLCLRWIKGSVVSYDLSQLISRKHLWCQLL
jgi:hypothetical protein